MTTTVTPIPARTDQQRRDALVIANRVRSYRAQLKREIKLATLGGGGYEFIEDLLVNPPEDLKTMRVLDFLKAIDRWGPQRTRYVLNWLLLSPVRQIGGLTVNERKRVLREARYFLLRNDGGRRS